MSYYYFGYVVVDFLDKLTRIGNGTSFNLGTPLTAALAGVTISALSITWHAVCRRSTASDVLWVDGGCAASGREQPRGGS